MYLTIEFIWAPKSTANSVCDQWNDLTMKWPLSQMQFVAVIFVTSGPRHLLVILLSAAMSLDDADIFRSHDILGPGLYSSVPIPQLPNSLQLSRWNSYSPESPTQSGLAARPGGQSQCCSNACVSPGELIHLGTLRNLFSGIPPWPAGTSCCQHHNTGRNNQINSQLIYMNNSLK